MEIYPAIDLMDGGCVRLKGGDFNERTNYDPDPVAVARRYRDASAEWLHLVDLDGARDPTKRQSGIIHDIARGADLKIQTGGGVRSAADVDSLLTLGISRVVIGSLSVRDFNGTADILARHGPEKIVLALDVRGSFEAGFFIATAGWQDTSTLSIETMLEQYRGIARHIICTDISKDGMMTGPNVGLYRYLCEAWPDMAFQASGGIARLEDLDAVREAGAAGVIIGKALYENKFTVADAMRKAA